ncbi:Ig-like domain repeat protein [Nocardioides eburneiflavus]|uniref:Ig-like domain repeat protein n=1 Tax=Nocardioides eburneiflavus TaxID=2518372 RepID=A0A4Z1CL88_9ACTN|nr:Ig-like domain-containing protein [Nocardioides eburneiflavus]TGN65540.1 Ig-like domain repeat protein [Nocardioides eburneiflavus]
MATALALPGSLLALTQAPAAAAPLPAAYSADAHGDIVDLTGDVLGLDVAGLVVGHSRSSVTGTTTDGSSTAASANLDASLVLDGVTITADGTSVTAPPSADPPAETLADVPVDAVADVGVITGDVQAAWAGSDACVPAVDGERVLSDSLTTLAGVTLVDAPDPVGTLAEMTDSQTRTRTALVDDADGSDVVSTTTTTVGDIDLLGGAVTVDVTNPVVLEARSDGTTGSAGFVDPPTVTATVGGTPVDIPLNGTPQQIDLPVLLEPLVDLSVTAFTPTDQSTGATGQGTLDALLRIDVEVLDATPLLPPVADFSLDVAPMSAQAIAPEGGVECAVDDEAPAAPVIDTPTDGDVTSDATPEFSGTAEPGSTVVVEDADGNEVCTDVAEGGSWGCTPDEDLPEGEATYSATATDDAGNTSEPDTVTFEVDTATTVDVLTPADGSTIPDATPEVSGTGEAGATIDVTEGGLPVCSTTVEPDGTWSCTPSLPLLPGEHTFTVTAEDEVGNTATATTTFTVDPDADDTDPPAAPVITAPAEGASVQDTTPQISGTGEPGATVTVSEGSTVLCTAVVATDTTWSCSPTVALPLGPHTVTATQEDAAGNPSPADTVSFTIVAPTPPVPGDTDGDGLPDGQEGTIGTDPKRPRHRRRRPHRRRGGQHHRHRPARPGHGQRRVDRRRGGRRPRDRPARQRHGRRPHHRRPRGQRGADQGAVRGLWQEGPYGDPRPDGPAGRGHRQGRPRRRQGGPRLQDQAAGDDQEGLLRDRRDPDRPDEAGHRPRRPGRQGREDRQGEQAVGQRQDRPDQVRHRPRRRT